jgi:aspartate 1-decarboxylase
MLSAARPIARATGAPSTPRPTASPGGPLNLTPERVSMRVFLRSKLHHLTVTEANLEYVGSVTLDEDLMDAADIREFEKVMIVDNTNGARLETYAIPGPRGSGVVCINGAAAHLIAEGDQVILMTFEVTEQPIVPRVILLDGQNRIARRLDDPALQGSKTYEELLRKR